jgi:hypothetical protein
MMLQERILGHIEIEFISRAGHRKDRNIVYNPDMGVGTSDNRCNGCSKARGIYVEKVGWGGLT